MKILRVSLLFIGTIGLVACGSDLQRVGDAVANARVKGTIYCVDIAGESHIQVHTAFDETTVQSIATTRMSFPSSSDCVASARSGLKAEYSSDLELLTVDVAGNSETLPIFLGGEYWQNEKGGYRLLAKCFEESSRSPSSIQTRPANFAPASASTTTPQEPGT